MKIVIDESVSYSLANILRDAGHTVIAIAESPASGLSDDEIFKIRNLSVSRSRKSGFAPQRQGLMMSLITLLIIITFYLSDRGKSIHSSPTSFIIFLDILRMVEYK